MSQVENNRAAIRVNRTKLFELESTVMWNKAQAYRERAMIEENRALILKNYMAAFIGNRQMANQNTDDILGIVRRFFSRCTSKEVLRKILLVRW